jgi:hypothetical protein
MIVTLTPAGQSCLGGYGAGLGHGFGNILGSFKTATDVNPIPGSRNGFPIGVLANLH